jgi:ribosomal protein L24
MKSFAVGEQVIVRYGRHQGQKAKIIESQTADTYRVKVEGGFVLFYSGKGLEREKEAGHQVM